MKQEDTNEKLEEINETSDEEAEEEVIYGDEAKPRRKFKVLIIILVILAVLAAVAVAVFFLGKRYIKSRFIDKINYESNEGISIDENVTIETDEPLVNEDNIDDVEKSLIDGDAKTFFENVEVISDNYVKNILLIGTDVRISDSWNGNSDSVILISINTKTKKIIMTSFMRDMYVYIPQVDKCGKLNSAHAYGAGDLLCATVSGNFKVHIDKYFRVDFYGLMDIIDAAGGIDMELIPEELPVANQYIRDMCKYTGDNPENYYLNQSGTIHLNGMQAVAYARIRYVGNADYERTNRQRKIINELIGKCKKMSMSEITDFADEALPNLTTNMNSEEIWDLLGDALKYLNYEVVSARVPFDDSSAPSHIDGQDVLLPDYKKNVELLIDTIYGN